MAKDINTASFGAKLNEIEQIGQARLATFWLVKTADPIMAVVRPGYFDNVLSHGLRAGDRIEVISIATTPATHATLAINEIRSPQEAEARVMVRVLSLDDGDLQ